MSAVSFKYAVVTVREVTAIKPVANVNKFLLAVVFSDVFHGENILNITTKITTKPANSKINTSQMMQNSLIL